MASHRQTALDCATRITNTMLMQGLIKEDEKLTEKIKNTADKFIEWLGPDPVRQGYGPKQEKPTYEKPCPVCGKEMFDLRTSKKNPAGPDARCKDTKWNKEEGKFDGCKGLFWPPKEQVHTVNIAGAEND